MQLNHRTNKPLAAARHPRMIAAAAAVAALAAASFALNPPATHAAQAKGAVVSTAKTSLGRIIVNSSGRTLYLFEKDRNGKSACSGQCAVFWPPLITSGKPGVTGGARASLIGTTKRADGRLQVTYNHHPLYTFVKDKKAGQTNGEGVNALGAVWDAMSPAGAKVEKPSDPPAGGYGQTPLKASVLSPGPGDSAGVGGTFSVDLSLEATTPQSNNLLAGYTAAFNDPNAPTFHPGPDAAAPGLVVLLSTTPTIAGTPLQGPNTNLAGVFQINDVTKTTNGRIHTFNSWIVTAPGFFGKATTATLTVYAVNGTAPALITGNEQPISNVVRENFTIAG